MRCPFRERAIIMGLEANEDKGLYNYSDRYGEVVYRQLKTSPSEENSVHETDELTVPLMAIYTKPTNNLGYRYCGYVSELYQFIGNDILNQQIREAIQEVGAPILEENTILSFDLTSMRNEIIIRSSQNVADVGDILPVMVINNSYDGTKAASISFGISTFVSSNRIVFSFKLGEMRQIHLVNANTQMTSVISSYLAVFSNNIADLVRQNFQSRLTEDQMLGSLDLIERIGKKRRDEISKLLQEIMPTQEGQTPQLPTAWQMFLAIARYSSLEPNLNTKRLLENAAESVLVIPTRMYNVLAQL
jgi:hypothetical protein